MNYLRVALLYCMVATVLAHPLTLRESNSACQKTKVAVLGAGVAGITAAVCSSISVQTLDPAKFSQQALSNNSISDFLIIEYNSEIGGRCRHASFGKDKKGNPYTIELGANWVRNP